MQVAVVVEVSKHPVHLWAVLGAEVMEETMLVPQQMQLLATQTRAAAVAADQVLQLLRRAEAEW
jgi:hypothetical protein